MAVVCGAGINCLGRSPDGREVRFLSLGEISGDWGGGVDVGLAALAAAARSADGRGPRTILETAVAAHFELTDPLEVSRALHLRQIHPARLGELAPLVLGACGEDAVAAGIVDRLADEVAALAAAALRRLELTESDPDVVLGGGLLRAVSPGVVETIAGRVNAVAPNARVLVSPERADRRRRPAGAGRAGGRRRRSDPRPSRTRCRGGGRPARGSGYGGPATQRPATIVASTASGSLSTTRSASSPGCDRALAILETEQAGRVGRGDQHRLLDRRPRASGPRSEPPSPS